MGRGRFGVAAAVVLIVAQLCWGEEGRWFGRQVAPKGVVRVNADGGAGTLMMVESVAGLAAKAVNEGKGDEMVWVASGGDVEKWYGKMMEGRPGFEARGEVGAWELVERYRKLGIV